MNFKEEIKDIFNTYNIIYAIVIIFGYLLYFLVQSLFKGPFFYFFPWERDKKEKKPIIYWVVLILSLFIIIKISVKHSIGG